MGLARRLNRSDQDSFFVVSGAGGDGPNPSSFSMSRDKPCSHTAELSWSHVQLVVPRGNATDA